MAEKLSIKFAFLAAMILFLTVFGSGKSFHLFIHLLQ